jgi:8-oxo-dGTP pyrophosphatase MutT (NUDIX family)
MESSQIKPAATIIISKVTTKWPYKILLIKRSEKARFLPGAHVFPGGCLEPIDDRMAEFLQKDEANTTRIMKAFLGSKRTLSFVAAAIRETLEETGLSILKIKTPDGTNYCSHSKLADLLAHGFSDGSIAASLDSIWPLSWWVTPDGEKRRYNTKFFFALIADSQENDVISKDRSNEEAMDPWWASPLQALARYEAKEIFLAPPTRAILERMASSLSLENFLSFVDSPIFPIKPYFSSLEGQKFLLLPGDPLHHERRASRLPLHTRYRFP